MKKPATLILLHNGFDSAKTWEPVMKYLPTNLRILAYDRKGYGSRFNPTQKLAPGDIVEEGIRELDELVDSLVPADNQVFLWGHCVGGAIALSWAGRNPNRPSAIIGEAVGFSSSQAMADKAHWLLRDYEHLSPEYKNHFDRMHGKNAPFFWEIIRNHTSSYIMDSEYTIVDDIKKIQAPVLCIQGNRDIYFTPEYCLKHAEFLTSGKVEIVPGGTHDLHTQAPKEMAQLVMDFLIPDIFL